MIVAAPPASDIVNASATATTAGIVTVPGGRWLTANVQLSASHTVAGTAIPRVTYVVPGGTSGAAPANGSTLACLSITSLTLTTICDSDTTEILVWGGDNGCTLDFNTGGASSASVTVNGFLL
jgi:hypothetical protein